MQSSSTHLDLLALHTLPLNSGRANNCRSSHDSRNEEGVSKSVVVCQCDTRKHVLFDRVLNARCSDVENDRRIHAWCILCEALGELVGEDVLTNGNEKSATKCLDKNDDTSSDGHFGNIKNGLDGNKRLLQP